VLLVEVSYVVGGLHSDLHELAGTDPLTEDPGQAVAGLA
jgi:hypothetical protein